MKRDTKVLDFTFVRDLNFEIKGKKSRGNLKIGGIEKSEKKDAVSFWVCYWSLSKVHPETGKIYGVDALDAFVNCVEFLAKLIARHGRIGYKIWWNTKGDNGGLGFSDGGRERHQPATKPAAKR